MTQPLLISLSLGLATLALGIGVSAVLLQRITCGMTPDEADGAKGTAAAVVLCSTVAVAIGAFVLAYV